MPPPSLIVAVRSVCATLRQNSSFSHLTLQARLRSIAATRASSSKMLAPVVNFKPNGPIIVKNVALKDDNLVPEEGSTVALCRCGRSKNKPFCDGSHASEQPAWESDFKASGPSELSETPATSFRTDGPILMKGLAMLDGKLVEQEGSSVALCRCGRSGNKPLCDGRHAGVSPKWSSSNDVGGTIDIEDIAGPSKQSNGTTSTANGGSKVSNYQSTEIEPTMGYIKMLAREGLTPSHGPMAAMGIPRGELPQWDDIQLLTGQLATKPLLDGAPVSTKVVIGSHCKRPLTLELPVFVSDMSFGALSRQSKLALARGAELAGTGICSGEGGSLDAERAENKRYFYEIASAFFGYDEELLKDSNIGAVHFKGGQAAKTGTGGHLSANKVTAEIARVRKLQPGEDAISPATFKTLHTTEDFKNFSDRVRELTGGAPIGFKLSAQHIEEDIQFAIDASADYIIIDGRGGATGAAPVIFRDNISVPTIPAVARARKYLDKIGATHVALVATGGIRTPADFVKALCLGADAVAISNSAIQAIGCVAARICHTNQCPSGIATQDETLASLINVDRSAKQLANFLDASKKLMQILARACGHSSTTQFSSRDITTWKRDMAYLTGIKYGGVMPL